MDDQLLDDQHLFDPDNWDSKKRLRVSDAIIEVNDHGKKLRGFRYFLIGLIIVNLLSAAYMFYAMPDDIRLDDSGGDMRGLIAIIMLVFMAPFIVAALFLPRNPRLWLGIGLVSYLLLSVFGGGLLNGVIWKVAITAALGYGLYSAFEWEKNLKMLREYGFPREQLAAARKNFTPLRRLPRKLK